MFFQEASTFSTDEQVCEEVLQSQEEQPPQLDLHTEVVLQPSPDSDPNLDVPEIVDSSDPSSSTSSTSSAPFNLDFLSDVIDDVNEELVDELWPPNVIDDLIAEQKSLSSDFADFLNDPLALELKDDLIAEATKEGLDTSDLSVHFDSTSGDSCIVLETKLESPTEVEIYEIMEITDTSDVTESTDVDEYLDKVEIVDKRADFDQIFDTFDQQEGILSQEDVVKQIEEVDPNVVLSIIAQPIEELTAQKELTNLELFRLEQELQALEAELTTQEDLSTEEVPLTEITEAEIELEVIEQKLFDLEETIDSESSDVEPYVSEFDNTDTIINAIEDTEDTEQIEYTKQAEETESIKQVEQIKQIEQITDFNEIPITQEAEEFSSSAFHTSVSSDDEWFVEELNEFSDLALSHELPLTVNALNSHSLSYSDLNDLNDLNDLKTQPDFSNQSLDSEVTPLEQLLTEVQSLRVLSQFHYQLQEDINRTLDLDNLHVFPGLVNALDLYHMYDFIHLYHQGSTIPEAHPYDFREELDQWEAEAAQAEQNRSTHGLGLVYSLEQSQRIQLAANRLQKSSNTPDNPTILENDSKVHLKNQIVSAQRFTLNIPQSLTSNQSTQVHHQTKDEIPSKEMENLSPDTLKELAEFKTVSVPNNRGVIKLQIDALDKLKSFPYHPHPEKAFVRVITLKASSQEEMGQVLYAKMGDFGKRNDILDYGKRCLGKITNEKNWLPMKVFITSSRVEKEVSHPSSKQNHWVIYNKKKGWKYTGNQQLTIEVKSLFLDSYYAKLEEKARTLAADSDQTRIYLSKKPKGSSDLQDSLSFWIRHGYQPKIQIIRQYWIKQKHWTVTHIKLDGFVILLTTLRSGRLDNQNLGLIASNWKDSHQNTIKNSTIVLKESGKELILDQILPSVVTNDPKLLSGKSDIECLNENEGATEVFQWQLEKTLSDLKDEIKNCLVEYMCLDKSIVDKCRPDINWGIVKDRNKANGIDKYGQEFRFTFAPDIMIEDHSNKIVAVIQLKGRSQNRSELTPTMSSIQMVELIKYHVEHEVPVAQVNIRFNGRGLQYEWLVIGKNNVPPSPIMKQLIDPKKGLDPILPRSARSRKFVEIVYNELKTNEKESSLNDLMSKFQDLVDKSQSKFQNLRFYKDNPKFINVELYWSRIIKKYNELYEKQPHPIEFDEFYKKWKEMIVLDYEEILKEMKFDDE